MRTEVATSHLKVTPGTPAVLDVEVTNTANVIDGVTASIQGLDPSWVALVMPVVSLFPESTSTLSLRIDLPRNCLAGEYLVNVHVVSIIDPTRFSDHEFWLSVEPFAAASLTMHPSLIIGGRDATFEGEIANEGNITLDLIVNAVDETRLLTCIANPATVSVPPGETHSVAVFVEGSRPWFGQPINRPISVEAVGTGLELRARATFTQKPRIPRGLLTFLILAGIIALWATVFLLVVSALRDKPAATKAPATNFNEGGNKNVNLAAVGATMGGTVTAASTGAPAPLITVEALRIRPDGTLVSVGSTGTGDDGSYLLASLLPGHYKLRFSADGFDEIWYPAAPDSGSAGQVNVAPSAAAEGLDVVMAGKPGSLAGQIVAPESSGTAAKIAVTVTQVIDKPKEGEPLPAPIAATVDAAGNFTVAPLITPADYTVHVEGLGFNPRDFKETLKAGENKVINTVTLGAAPGTIAGQVTSGDGTPLGGVDVTIRNGEFSKATKTPTSGNVGNFVLDGLVTPATYVLTFSLPGFADQTMALDLGSGASKLINVKILGGTGTIAGTVTDTAGNTIGGVTVAINHGTVSATTTTLTSSTDLGQTGSYSVTGLPTPGSYTVTFTSPGYSSQTIRVDLASAGSLAGVNAVLPKSTGSISGTVTASSAGSSQPAADVIVELSNGDSSTLRSTATATAPAGAYRFADVTPGSYTLTFRKAGLATRVVIVEVVGDQNTPRDISLPSGP